MRATQVTIHNFRSIKEITIDLEDCSLLAGPNNSGKSNVIDAVRLFYNDIKWEETRDFPKFETEDDETWVEIEFKPNENELSDLKEEYKLPSATFRVRNYIKSSKDDPSNRKVGYYGYENGTLSETPFYGAKNVGAGKIGEIIYIPAVTKVDESTKLSGPSALRDLITKVTAKVLSSSTAYSDLQKAFNTFESKIKTETTAEGESLQKLEEEITASISSWGTTFKLGIHSIKPDDIVKTLIHPEVFDNSLQGGIDLNRFGAGFQRHLVYSLLKLAAQHSRPSIKPTNNSKEFSPSLNWILFEEPEAFLHPSQEDALYDSLLELCEDGETQVLMTTHSSRFVSRSMNDLTRLTRIRRKDGMSSAFHLSRAKLDELLQKAVDSAKRFSAKDDFPDHSAAMSALKTRLWMQDQRSAAFFARHVILVEGVSELALYMYLTSHGLLKRTHGLIFVDCLGKFNIPRFMSFFGALGIDHSVLYDGDQGRAKDAEVQDEINKARNDYTHKLHRFEEDLEKTLGIPPIDSSLRHLKPEYLLYHLEAKKVDEAKIAELCRQLESLY